jgi:hypothetical protein
LILTPIRQVLFTIQTTGTRALLMGGQACVFYGAAQVSKDVNFLIHSEQENFEALHLALRQLDAKRIAIPRFNPALLEKGHAVHFRCTAPVVEGLRIGIMTRLRGMSSFDLLWERRTVVAGDNDDVFNLLSVPDLVEAKKTQRAKDWPVIDALVSIHYRGNRHHPTAEWIDFWLKEARSAELITDLTRRFPQETARLLAVRPLLTLARDGDMPSLRAALDAEVRAEQEKDRQCWEPLKREMEAFRREERGA